MKILILNGPNLNLIGQREPEIYGNLTFEEALKLWSEEFSFEIDFFQSNVEGELINALQKSDADGIIFNAGAYTHTSIALRDTVSAISIPVMEVHLSNITKRESFRHESYLTLVCVGCIFGLGMDSYRLALTYFQNKN
ncbi:MAG: type II 3-dehydroquinate dehydratase [Crocinitomicaceae bacterium]|jgi:3-dehydroquinate dehydratase II|nr:type II 3-dehydroquinate dehydratase [Crocinitomicaceae bacterium]MDG2463650.1 type II 3-dehydroquinate dehydratase [Crocinitomicaceae bacterium]